MDLMDQHQQQFDSHYEYVANVYHDPGQVVNIKQQAFHAMRQLEGWCAESKASILIDYVLNMQPDTIVEIGVFGGKSLVPMAIALRANGKGRAYGIDPWSPIESVQGMDEVNRNWWISLDHQRILNGLIEKISQFGLQDQISLIRATSEGAPIIYDIDILHIDGNHSEETSYFDITKWVPQVRQGGIVILDDITWMINGVSSQSKSVDWLNQHCVKLGQYHDGCDWGIWIKL